MPNGKPSNQARDQRGLNALKEAVPATAQLQMRVTPDRKLRYVNQAKAEGPGLTDWVQKHMDNVCDLAGQPDTTMYKDDGETSGQNNNSLKQHVFNMLSAGSELKEVKRFHQQAP